MPDRDLIADGRKLLEAASPAPWSIEYDSDGDEYADDDTWPSALVGPAAHDMLGVNRNRVTEILHLSDADAELIAHMRNTYGQLLDELEQARARISLAVALAERWGSATELGTGNPSIVAQAFAAELRNALADRPAIDDPRNPTRKDTTDA